MEVQDRWEMNRKQRDFGSFIAKPTKKHFWTPWRNPLNRVESVKKLLSVNEQRNRTRTLSGTTDKGSQCVD